MATSEAQLRSAKKYNEAHTTTITVRLPNELAKTYKQKCEDMGIGHSAMLRRMVEDFVNG